MECPMLCGSQAADEFHCPDCGWERILSSDYCGESLYVGGVRVGTCAEPYGTEHDHSDPNTPIRVFLGLDAPREV